MSLDTAWKTARLAKAKEMVVALEDAILAIANGAQTYMLDTGQTRQSVTRADLGSLRLQLREAENLVAERCAALTPDRSYIFKPGW